MLRQHKLWPVTVIISLCFSLSFAHAQIKGMEARVIFYFSRTGKQNTDATLAIARDYAVTNNIKTVTVASTTGFTAEKALQTFKETGIKLIVVGHGRDSFRQETARMLKAKAHKLLFAEEVKYHYDLAAQNALRLLCQGMKVATEIVMIAVNAKDLPAGEEVVSIAGTAHGADTAVVIIGASSNNIRQTKIQKILCKPLL